MGEALIFYEGEHTDNQHRKHQIPAERIQLLAANTNADYNQGRDIPLKFEHRKLLIGDDGAINEFGKMASAVSCRPIEESDLANPRLRHLIGKLGAFASVQILDKIDAVKNKTIRALSAGIDPVKNKFIEISAVSSPSLPGAALLFSRTNYNSPADFSTHGITDYDEAWEKVTAWEKPHQELQKRFDVFLGTLNAIEMEKDAQPIVFNPNGLKRKALEGFVDHLIDYLKIEIDGSETNPDDIYNKNPYDSQIINNGNGRDNSADNNYSHPIARNAHDLALNFQRAAGGESEGAPPLNPKDKRSKRKKRRK